MAVLIPAPFADLVTRLHREPEVQDTLFGLPRRKWYRPDEGGPDLGVMFHGRHAGTPVGPAAGPHTQMAQNLLLSYAAGGRIIELKTVQANDRLTIPRPCIDLAGVGYNVEWSQELRLEDSLREYVGGAMLIEMFRRGAWGRNAGLDGPVGDVIYEVSVGYDWPGIRSEKMSRFLEAVRDCRAVAERLRAEIPPEFAAARAGDPPRELAANITLSTFHGCPPEEIEQICEFLLAEQGFDVSVKLNPPLLGRERLEHLLHDVLGYRDIEVNPRAYTTGLTLPQTVELCRRLSSFAASRGRHFGVKLCNTLEVRNHRDFFGPDCQTMYLSGQPLYVLAMNLARLLRDACGPELPFSYSGGIDQDNFAEAVSCGFVPVTVCTDLLRPGGYGRLPEYLRRLTTAMREVTAPDLSTFIRARAGARFGDATTAEAAARNLARVAGEAAADERYRPARVCREPRRLDSSLSTFDCIACDRCIPVCPNAAIFSYPTTPGEITYDDILVTPNGKWHRAGTTQCFRIENPQQIAVYADFCNECGNCGTFCPERGAPYRDKPVIFGSLESWRQAVPRDGYFIHTTPRASRIEGRLGGGLCLLELLDEQPSRFQAGPVQVVLDARTHEVISVELLEPIQTARRIDLGKYHTLLNLLTGILNPRPVNQLNIASHGHASP